MREIESMTKLIVKKRNLLQLELFLFLFILYRPEYVLENSYLDEVINGFRVLLTLILLFKIVIKGKVKKIIFPILIWGYFNIFCLLNNTWTFSVFIEYAIIIDIFVIVAIYYPKYKNDLYLALSDLLFLYGICNTVTILLGNSYEQLFLGFDNDIAMRIIPLIGVQLYLSLLINGMYTKKDIFIYAVFLLDYVLTVSASGLISLIVLFFMVHSHKLSYKYIKSCNIIALSIVFFALLYFLKIQNTFSFLLSFLSKDITLSYRTYIWESVLEAIKQAPMLGYGNIGVNMKYINIVYPMYYASIFPHNIWLYLVSSSGLVGFCGFSMLIVRSFRNVDTNYSGKANKVLIATLFSYLLCGTFASYYGIEYFCFLLAIAYNSGVSSDKSITL